MDVRLSYFALLLALALGGCKPGAPAETELASIDEWLPLRIEGVEIQAQVAVSHAEQRKGLMFRERLPEDGGMLFPYAQPRRLSFWMKNTPLPLDIGFFNAEGVLLEIRRLIPHDTIAVSSRSADAQYALEMNSGWFAGKGLYPGSRLDLESVAQALRRRGEDPRLYRLETTD